MKRGAGRVGAGAGSGRGRPGGPAERPAWAVGLTERQWEIARWLAAGFSVPSVAVVLGLREKTERGHLSRIRRAFDRACRRTGPRRSPASRPSS